MTDRATQYSDQFVRRVLETIPEGWSDDAYLDVHLDGPQSRLTEFRTQALPELEFHCGSLEGRRVLEYGCGKGSATVSIATAADEVFAFDIDARSVDVCRARLAEHGLENVSVHHAPDFESLRNVAGTFDVVVLHAVLEHVPISVDGLRGRVLREAFSALRPGGYLFIFETPNRLWPRDIHTTGLWLIPWTRAGSPWAYRRAVAAGKHHDRPDVSPGPLGLEERGAWGATYFGVRAELPRGEYRVVNLEPGHDRWVRYTRTIGTKRRVLETALYWTATRYARIPVVAFAPMLSPLVICRVGGTSE